MVVLYSTYHLCPFAAKFLQPLLAYTLSKLRAPKSSEGYKAIGGGSPLRRITDEQAAALSEALRRKGQNADVYVAMRYWYPFTEEALQKIKDDNVTRLVVLPLYPQFSISTSGSSLRLLEEVSLPAFSQGCVQPLSRSIRTVVYCSPPGYFALHSFLYAEI